MAETSAIKAITADVSFNRGETWEYLYTVTSDGSSPVDITGATIVFRLKRTPNGDVLVSKSSAAGSTEVEITDAANGQYKVKLLPSDTRGLRQGLYCYDIWIQDIPSAGDEYAHVILDGANDRNCEILESVFRTSDAINSTSAIGPSILDSDFAAAGIMYRNGSEDYTILKSNLAATGAPSTGDDGADGYSVGSLWIDTSNNEVYWCADAATGAAVWKQIGSGSGGGGGGVTDHGALTGLADDDHTQYLLASGARALAGDLDMGANAITNVGNVDGRDVSADGSKLDGIEASADVTDAANVAAAGAVMDGDFSANGRMIRAGAGSYSTVLDNLTASTAPGVGDDSGDGYSAGSIWVDATGDEVYLCADASVGAAVWKRVEGGALDIAGLTNETNLSGVDEFVFHDDSAGAQRALTFTALLNEIDSELSPIADSDFSANGRMVRTGAGSYATVLDNLSATTDPGVGDDTNDGYAPGSIWVNTTTPAAFICISASAGAADWNQIDGAGGGGMSDLVDDTTPELGGDLDTNGNSILVQERAAPSTPAANHVAIYADSTSGNLSAKFDTGTAAEFLTPSGDLAIADSAKVYLDTDQDSYFYCNGDDNVQLYAGASRYMRWQSGAVTADASFVTAEAITMQGKVFINNNAVTSSATTIGSTGAEEATWPVNTSGGAFTLTLPAATNAGELLIICDANGSCATNNLTIAAAAGDAILGASTSLVIDANHGSVTLKSLDTTNWIICGGQGYTAT